MSDFQKHENTSSAENFEPLSKSVRLPEHYCRSVQFFLVVERPILGVCYHKNKYLVNMSTMKLKKQLTVFVQKFFMMHIPYLSHVIF